RLLPDSSFSPQKAVTGIPPQHWQKKSRSARNTTTEKSHNIPIRFRRSARTIRNIFSAPETTGQKLSFQCTPPKIPIESSHSKQPSSRKMMPSHHNQPDAHGDTERHQQSVQHSPRPGDI